MSQQQSGTKTAKSESKNMTDTASAAITPFDASVELFRDWQDFVKAGADLIGDATRTSAKSLQELLECRSPHELRATGASVAQETAARWVESGKTLVTLSAEHANRRLQSTANWAVATIKQAREL